MDAPATLGPLIRAQARAIEAKVNSILTESLINMHETWVLPHGTILCIIRYTGDARGEAQDQGQVAREEETQGREEAAPKFERLTTFGRPTCIGIPTT